MEKMAQHNINGLKLNVLGIYRKTLNSVEGSDSNLMMMIN